MTTVSIVIPCYRYGSFLRQCVESVLSQEGVDAQVLIIDDASPDDSASVGRQLASEHPRVVFHAHEVNRATSLPITKASIGRRASTSCCFPRMTTCFREH